MPKGVSEATRDQVMNEAVAAALMESKYLLGPIQFKGLADFSQVYQAVKRFDALTTEWSDAGSTINTFAHGDEREFTAAYWNAHVLPHITGDGAVTPGNLSTLSHQVYFLLRHLEGIEPEALQLGIGGCGDQYVTGLLYNPELVPQNMRTQVADLVDRYVRSSAWFFHANQMECEGEGCPKEDEISYLDVERIGSIQASPLSFTVVDYVYCKY